MSSRKGDDKKSRKRDEKEFSGTNKRQQMAAPETPSKNPSVQHVLMYSLVPVAPPLPVECSAIDDALNKMSSCLN